MEFYPMDPLGAEDRRLLAALPYRFSLFISRLQDCQLTAAQAVKDSEH
jgi:hypothetical protein